MIKRIKGNEEFRRLFLITAVYIATHWFLIAATGRWWDDWVYADKNWDYLFEVFKQSSLPMHAFIDAGLWLFPDGSDRIFTFFLFYAGAILIYRILGKIDLFSKDACLWIVLLYIVAPVNDARITWICYGYSLGLFMFWLAFYLGTLWREYRGVKRVIVRALSLFFLMVSFDTESIMMLTFLILGYYYYEELKDGWKQNGAGTNIKRFFMAVVRHIDYLLAPVVWYFGDKILFPGYGMYDGHSYIQWNDLPGIVRNSFLNAYKSLKTILKTLIDLPGTSRSALFAVILVLAIYVFWKKAVSKSGKAAEDPSGPFLKDLLMTLLGCAVFFLGFFPYAVKRDSPIVNTYTGGRDSLLLGLGTAIILYYGVHVLLRQNITKAALLSLVVLGVIHFNFIYLDWQECYYQQLQLQHEIRQNEEIRNNDTFLVMFRGAIISSVFYQTNGNSWAATGEETRLYMSGTSSLELLVEMNEDAWVLNAYGMNEYKCGDKIVDGIIFVDYSDISRKTVLRQKINELFDKDSFNAWIDEIKSIQYVPLTKTQSDELIRLFNEKKLKDKMIYDMYY